MIMDVEIISMEKIKPYLPTPNYLKNFKLSSLDCLIPAAYAPIVFFYPNHNSANHTHILERIHLLKQSLSKILARFFPLAGSIKNGFFIDCDDEGACFITAKATFCLNEFLESPQLNLISHFLPNNIIESCVSNIQVTVFECGGISIGVCISHRILDGTGLSFFLKSWGEAATSSKHVLVLPDSSASALFPAYSSELKDASMAMWGSLFKKGSFITKRFVFDARSISTLRDRANEAHPPPTRVQTVSAFIWERAMLACEGTTKNGSKKSSLISHVVNLRKRAVPNFSEQSLGNLIWIASTKITPEERNKFGFLELVDEVRKSISKIDGEYVKKLHGDEGSSVMIKFLKEIEESGSKGVDYFGFSSWCNMGFYDVDFGWGKPIWVSSIEVRGPFFMNLTILMETRDGNGIEAWMTMDEQELDVLERDEKFLAFASLNPSPLHVDNAKIF